MDSTGCGRWNKGCRCCDGTKNKSPWGQLPEAQGGPASGAWGKERLFTQLHQHVFCPHGAVGTKQFIDEARWEFGVFVSGFPQVPWVPVSPTQEGNGVWQSQFQEHERVGAELLRSHWGPGSPGSGKIQRGCWPLRQAGPCVTTPAVFCVLINRSEESEYGAHCLQNPKGPTKPSESFSFGRDVPARPQSREAFAGPLTLH